MGLYDFTTYSIMKRNARVYNDRVALMCGKQRISYQQILEKVDLLASGFMSVGINKGDRIGIFARNSWEFLVICGAAAKIGAILMPINWRLTSEEAEYIINDGSPKVLIFGHEFQSLIAPMISKFSFIKEFCTIDEYKSYFRTLSSLTENETVPSNVDVCSDEPYLIIYTGAVDGKPRGAVLSHRGILASNIQSMYYFRLSTQDVHLVILPMFHLASIAMTLSIMQAGGLNIILPSFDVGLALKHIEEDKVTIFAEFSPILKNLMSKAKEDKYDLSSLRIVCGLDDIETVKRFEAMTGARFWSAYGQTETSGMITYSPHFEKSGSVGFPGFLAQIEIMDDYGKTLEVGGIGEIVLRGPMVFKGYWNSENNNEFTFRDGWYHTGDMGRFDEYGQLWYSGRSSAKELIKTGGENVYPVEVERIIMEHPSIEDVAVIGVPDPQWGEAIKSICVLKKEKSLSESELIEFVGTRIARFKKPKHVIFVSDIPKTKDGYNDRDRVKEYYGRA